MRTVIYKRVTLFTLIFGLISGIISSFFGTEVDEYGSWLISFYKNNNTELWLKAIFSGPFFVFAVFILGFFIFGYLFVYPVNFYYTYTFGFLITSSVMCYGSESVISIALKLPAIVSTCFFLIMESVYALQFSSDIFSSSGYRDFRDKTSQYMGQGFCYVMFSVATTVYDAVLVPKILNLLVSF